MISKKFVTGTIVSTLLVLSATPSLAAVNEKQVQKTNSVQEVQSEKSAEIKFNNEQEMYYIAQKAEKYFVKNVDGTLSLNATAEQLGTTEENLNQYRKGVEAINLAVATGNVKVNVNANTNSLALETVAPSNQSSLPSWTWDSNFYGWNFYLSNSESKTFVYNCNKWAAGAAGVAVITGYVAAMGVPQAAAAALAAGLISAGLWWVGNEVDYRMTSKGTKIYLSNWNPVNIVQISGR
ncbi:hypothetical protein [Bacillus cereus]|uniref:hypothetical protein n=1 Tax=Bacillus cereus TaxID=1396 RepID=UPI00027C0523|nr:hypothetical protein [Bacillus cereus]EJV57002.1 hypothetical protein IEM_05053 [Bacillus cereus BAG6O-2]